MKTKPRTWLEEATDRRETKRSKSALRQSAHAEANAKATLLELGWVCETLEVKGHTHNVRVAAGSSASKWCISWAEVLAEVTGCGGMVFYDRYQAHRPKLT